MAGATAGDMAGAMAGGSAPPPTQVGALRCTPPELLEPTELSYMVQVAANPRGDVAVAWDQTDGKVKARVFDAMTETWSPSVSVDREDNPDAAAIPNIALDARGNAIASWQRQSAVEDMFSVWTNRYEAASRTWATPELIAGSQGGGIPQVAFDEGGDALMVFSLLGDLTGAVATARVEAASGMWTPSKQLTQPAGYLHSGGAIIGMQPTGDAVVAWISRKLEQLTMLVSKVYVARYTAATNTWGPPQPLGTDTVSTLVSGIAINPAGVAFVVWTEQMGDEEISVWSSRSADAGATWSKPQRIDAPGLGLALLPDVEVDADGNALAVWTADDLTRQSIYSNRYLAADGGWQTPTPVETEDLDDYVVRLGMDGQGNALAIWTRDDGMRESPWASWFDAKAGKWSAPAALEVEGAGTADSVYSQIAVAPNGSAIAAWYRKKAGVVVSRCR